MLTDLLLPVVLAINWLFVPADASPINERGLPMPWTNFVDNPVYKPQSGWTDPGTLYARTLQLADSSLLITSEIYAPDDPLALPIFRSTDGGATWKNYTRFYDKVNGWGMRYQPFLYTLPIDFGGFPAGTTLAVGTSIPKDLSQAYIDLYASIDNAKTFNFVSHIAYGSGPELTDNGDKAIWEAFLLMYEDQLICFYSDQRDPNHAQKLVHTTTKDLRTWSQLHDDVTRAYYDGRPGMTTVAYSPKSGQYVMTFEDCGAPQNNCQIHYKVSDSPLWFNNKEAIPVVSLSGKTAYGNPYITWVLDPRKSDGSGLFIVNGGSDSALYINDDNAHKNSWTRVEIGSRAAYSRSLRIITTPSGQSKLLIGSGGEFRQLASNAVRVSVLDIPVPN